MPAGNGARILDSRNDLNLREQEIKHILGSYDDDQKDSEMCDMACQTRWVINQFRIFHFSLRHFRHLYHIFIQLLLKRKGNNKPMIDDEIIMLF